MIFGCVASVSNVELVKEAGLAFTEIHGKAIDALTDEAFDDLCRRLEALELPCIGFNAYCPPEITIAGPKYDREQNRAYIRRLARRAEALHIKQVGVGSPKSRILPEDFDRKLAFRQVEEFLLDNVEVYAPLGIGVALEPLADCFCNCVNTCDEALEIISRLQDAHVGLIYDLYSMERQGEADRSIMELMPYISHVHISDDVAGEPYSRCMLHPLRYELHRKRLQRLQDAGYTGTVSLETDLPLSAPQLASSAAFLRTI